MNPNEEERGISIEEAVKRLCDAANTITDSKYVPLARAFGRIASEDIRSEHPIPSFRRSAMDGYAVIAADTVGIDTDNPAIFEVTGSLMAGDHKDIPCRPGSAVRIMTGAYIPEGYDAVIKQEDTDMGKHSVTVFASAKPGMNVCEKGEDIGEGEIVARKCDRIGRIEAGLIAACGIAEVPVLRKVRVAIISTGSELLAPGQDMQCAKIYENISAMLKFSIEEAGCKTVLHEMVGDDAEMIQKALKKAVECADIIITTGGVSVGKKDLMPQLLNAVGAKKLFSHVDIQPGTPTLAAVYKGKPTLALSGNPYAALANFDCYFYPLIAKMTGCRQFETKIIKAVLKTPYEKTNKMRRLIRAYYDNAEVSIPATDHHSSVIANLRACNCYIDLQKGQSVSVGDTVNVRMM